MIIMNKHTLWMIIGCTVPPITDFPSAIILHYWQLFISHFYSCHVRLAFIDVHASWGT